MAIIKNIKQQKRSKYSVKTENEDEISKFKLKQTQNEVSKNTLSPKSKTKPKESMGSGALEEYINSSYSSNFRRLPKIQVLEKHVLSYIIAQDNPVRSIITAVYRAKKLENIKSNILIIGKSGTGKTETLNQIAKKLDLVYSIEDATKYTEEGYYGNDVNDMLYNLMKNADYDILRAENGMLIIDEIDKKANNDIISGRDISGVSVLKSLLKLIEGTKVKVKMDADSYDDDMIDFDTSKLIVFFSGAFVGLDKIREKRLRKNAIGFKCNTKGDNIPTTRYIKRDLIEYGLPEEFVGRIDTIIEMNNLKESDLVEILTRSRLSIFKKYKDALKEKGIALKYNKKLFQLIAKNALDVDTGARELSNCVNYIFEKIIYEILSEPSAFKKCILYPDIINDNSKFKLL